MQLTQACSAILTQLSGLVDQLSDADFTKSLSTLNGSSVGQHLRHTLEFFICLEQGYDKNVVNYDNRLHDKLIETDRLVAINTLVRIQEFVASQKVNIPLTLEVGYDPHNDDTVAVPTNYFRELTYNIEHAVHHMAIIKIAVKEVAPDILLPKDFGLAVSTMRYQQKEFASA
ncbi:MAG: hypothetical protein ACKO96_20935 [Flammeovirgaceae bacterium]